MCVGGGNMHSKTDGPADNVTVYFFPSGWEKIYLKTKQKTINNKQNKKAAEKLHYPAS